MKNWLRYVTGTVSCEITDSNATYKWVEDGLAYIDPGAIVSVAEHELGAVRYCAIYTAHQDHCVAKTAAEVIADIQSALSD